MVRTDETPETGRVDAEFFQPRFLKFDRLAQETGQPLVELFVDIIQPAEFIREYVPAGEGAVFWRAQNVRRGYVDEDNVEHIDWKIYEQIPQSHVREGDVLITRTGANAGDCAVVPPGIQNVAVSSHTLRLVPKDVEIAYTVGAFFASEYGREVLLRSVSGSSRPQITKEALATIELPDFSSIKGKITELIRAYYCEKNQAAFLYAEAEALLLTELGLDDLDLSHQTAYTRNASQAWAVGRLDAEYFQPKYEYVIDAIQRTGQWVLLDDIVTFCQRGSQPVYVEAGPIKVVNTKHLKPMLLSDDLEMTSEKYWAEHEEAQLRPNDALLYSTGAYIGRTNYYRFSERAIGSNHVTIIRTTDACSPVFLALFLNTLPGLTQTDKHAHGSAQREIYPDDIKQFVIWLPDRNQQNVLAQMVVDAHIAQKEANDLLEEAKRRVEEMVLGEEA